MSDTLRNHSLAVLLLNKHCRAVMVTYDIGDNAPRTLFKTFDQTIEEDDYVVVPTSTRHGMTVCKVAECDVDVDFDSSTQVNWIIGKVNPSDHEAVLKSEDEAIKAIKLHENRQKRERLLQTMMGEHSEVIDGLAISAIGHDKPAEETAAE